MELTKRMSLFQLFVHNFSIASCIGSTRILTVGLAEHCPQFGDYRWLSHSASWTWLDGSGSIAREHGAYSLTGLTLHASIPQPGTSKLMHASAWIFFGG